MKRIIAVPAGALLIGVFAAAYAELPPPTPEEKAAAATKAEKAAVEKEKAAKEVAKAQDKAVSNYRENKDSSSAAATAQPRPENAAIAQAQAQSPGADHSNAGLPDSELTRQEADKEMPKPGQVNDYSTPSRDPQNSSDR
jgi:hypothetical protein